jgi:hypothetical protein
MVYATKKIINGVCIKIKAEDVKNNNNNKSGSRTHNNLVLILKFILVIKI